MSKTKHTGSLKKKTMSLVVGGIIALGALGPQVSKAADDSQLSFGRQLVDRIDEAHISWVDSLVLQYHQDLCNASYPELDKKGFDEIRSSAQRLTGHSYAFSDLPQGIGIDFSDYQSITEEVFFDSLIRSRLDQYSCRKSAINCLSKEQVRTEAAAEFVDRLTVFKVYRDKFRTFSKIGSKVSGFSVSEKNLLKKYFTGDLDNLEKFFETWDPIAAVSVIVNKSDSGSEKDFLFQEAFTTIAEDESMMANFGKFSREKQLKTIKDIIKGTSDNQKAALQDEEDYWLRSCRPDDLVESKTPANLSRCFYRPTYEQKRKLLNEYALSSLFESNQSVAKGAILNLKNFSKPERAFFCKLNMRYGKGAEYFDAKMNNILMVFAMIPPARALIGAVAVRRLSFAILLGAFENRYAIGEIIAGIETIGAINGSMQSVLQMERLYSKCTSAKFKTQQPFPYVSSLNKQPLKSRDQMLRECRSCNLQPKVKKNFDISCAKEATNWLIGKSLGAVGAFGHMQLAARMFAQDHTGQTPVSKKLSEVSDAISMFYYNLSLTNPVGPSGLSDYIGMND